MIIVAFDPGRITSYARFDTECPHEIALGVIDLVGSGRLLRPCPIHIEEVARDADAAIVEEVGARPEQGVSSVFTFGLAVGTILGALGAMRKPITMVSPQKWKKDSRIGNLKNDAAKTAARQFALELWPAQADLLRVKKNHGLAEAALMARWYLLSGPGRDVPCEADSSIRARAA